MRTDGAGIGQRQADLQTEIGRGIIQRGNLQRIVLPGDDDAGMIISQRDVAAPFDAVGGQARQPQAEDTPPAC